MYYKILQMSPETSNGVTGDHYRPETDFSRSYCYGRHKDVCLSDCPHVCPSVTLCIVALQYRYGGSI